MNILLMQECYSEIEQATTESVFAQNEIIGIYFTVPTSVQCMDFVETLNDVYFRLREGGKKFEVLQADCTQVSAIRKRSTKGDLIPATAHWKNLPEGCVPALAQAFRVRRVPCLVVLRTNGDIVSLDFTASLERLKTDSWKRWVGEHVIDRMPLYMLSIENVD